MSAVFPCPDRTSIRRLVAGAVLVLAACAPRGGITFDEAAAEVGVVETIFVATDRTAVEGQPLFTRRRSSPPSFLRFRISVPPDREPGTVTFPTRYPVDPRTDFVTVDAVRLGGENAFIDGMNREMPPGGRETMLFVHGFNTSFAEGLYRQAQLQHDTGSRSVQVHYAWASAAALQGYVYDRESALYSRDGLEETIRAVSRTRTSGINLVAHSMGAFLLMDTLRTMARVGYDEVFARVNGVILLSPDIEIDVFRQQARPLIDRGVPILVVVSRRDRALLASALIRGERERLGSINSLAQLGEAGITVVDISEVDSPDALGHFSVATSPVMLDYLQSLRSSGLDIFETRSGPLELGVSLIQEGTDLILSPLTPLDP